MRTRYPRSMSIWSRSRLALPPLPVAWGSLALSLAVAAMQALSRLDVAVAIHRLAGPAHRSGERHRRHSRDARQVFGGLVQDADVLADDDDHATERRDARCSSGSRRGSFRDDLRIDTDTANRGGVIYAGDTVYRIRQRQARRPPART